MRLIDADALHKALFAKQKWVVRYGDKHNAGYTSDQVHFAIDDAPTIDAIEVVRCRDCRWGREVCGNIECSVDLNLPPEYHGYEWYCPNGERKEDELD